MILTPGEDTLTMRRTALWTPCQDGRSGRGKYAHRLTFALYMLSDSNQDIKCPMPRFLHLSTFTPLFWEFLSSTFSYKEIVLDGPVR